MTPGKATALVLEALSDDLRKPQYRGHPQPLRGHCYVASEAIWHLLGGRAGPWVPACLRLSEDEVHWWLEKDSPRGVVVLDATRRQFHGDPVPYHDGSRKGFLTQEPSKRALTVIERISAEGVDNS